MNSSFTISTHGDVKVLRPALPMPEGIAHVDAFREDLKGLLAELQPCKLLFDLSTVALTESLSLGLMASLHKKLQDAGFDLRFCNVHPATQWAFEATRLTEIFRIYPSEEEALADFASSP